MSKQARFVLANKARFVLAKFLESVGQNCKLMR